MLAPPTHIANSDFTIVKSIAELSAEDLAHLLSLKRSEPDARREAEDHELRRMLWRQMCMMPKDVALEIAAQIESTNPSILLDVYIQAFLEAVFGPGDVATVGAHRKRFGFAVAA